MAQFQAMEKEGTGFPGDGKLSTKGTDQSWGWSAPQGRIFVIGWVAYASAYLLRKPLAVIKVDLQSSFGFSTVQLGWLDTALLLPYALLQMGFGRLGDQLGSRQVFAAGLVVSSLSMMFFGLCQSWSAFALLLAINGAAQSQCWPNCTKVLSSWFPDPATKLKVFGMFGTCVFSGALAATTLAVFIRHSAGWTAVYVLPSVITLLMGLCVWFFYREAPLLPAPTQRQPDHQTQQPGRPTIDEPTTGTGKTFRRGFLQLWGIPAVPEIALSVFCLKAVRYCVYMWMPMYLHKKLSYEEGQAAVMSTAFDVGGMVGSLCIGYALERFFHGRKLVGITFSILCTGASLVLFHSSSQFGMGVNMACLFIIGIFNCGPDPILNSAIPNELGQMEGRNSAAAVTGLVNGFGSIGTFLQSPLVGAGADRWGWSFVNIYMIGMSVAAAAASYRAHLTYSRISQNPRNHTATPENI